MINIKELTEYTSTNKKNEARSYDLAFYYCL